MTTKPDADALHDAIADGDQWAKPKKAPKSAKRQRAAVISVRLTSDELRRVQALADGAHLPISTFLRDRALREADERLTVGSLVGPSYRHTREITSQQLQVNFGPGTAILNWPQPTGMPDQNLTPA